MPSFECTQKLSFKHKGQTEIKLLYRLQQNIMEKVKLEKKDGL